MSDERYTGASQQEMPIIPVTKDTDDTFGQFTNCFNACLLEQHAECTSEELDAVRAYLRLTYEVLAIRPTVTAITDSNS